jgi:hypothetical protein
MTTFPDVDPVGAREAIGAVFVSRRAIEDALRGLVAAQAVLAKARALYVAHERGLICCLPDAPQPRAALSEPDASLEHSIACMRQCPPSDLVAADEPTVTLPQPVGTSQD